MKKILSIVIGIILVATVFAACSKEVNTDATATTDKSTTVQSDSSTEINTITTTESTTQSTSQATYKKNVIVSFNAVIYDQSYDLNGYLESCQFHKKCEACGYVSNSNGQARGNLSTSYHCTQCGNNQAVEIVANFECVEVPYDN